MELLTQSAHALNKLAEISKWHPLLGWSGRETNLQITANEPHNAVRFFCLCCRPAAGRNHFLAQL